MEKIIYYEGKPTSYVIYDVGKIYNTKTKKFLIGSTTHNSGYIIVGLSINGKRKSFSVHRLVAEYFLENPNNLPIVNHKDGNKTNNKVENLEWVSATENQNHAIKQGLKRKNFSFYREKYICDLDDEKWVSYRNNAYLVSNKGRIRNPNTGFLLKGSLYNSGYICYQLRNGGPTLNILGQKLFYLAFHPELEEIPEGYVINHIDGNKSNNCLDNLEMITASENVLHGIYSLRTNRNIKNVIKYSLDGKMLKEYSSAAEAARDNTGYNATNILRACKKDSHKYKDFLWKYA